MYNFNIYLLFYLVKPCSLTIIFNSNKIYKRLFLIEIQNTQ